MNHLNILLGITMGRMNVSMCQNRRGGQTFIANNQPLTYTIVRLAVNMFSFTVMSTGNGHCNLAFRLSTPDQFSNRTTEQPDKQNCRSTSKHCVYSGDKDILLQDGGYTLWI